MLRKSLLAILLARAAGLLQLSTRLTPRRLSRLPSHRTVGGDGLDGGYTAILVVPTGIGASIGGFAGDAMPVARVLGSVVDTLITHPNVMNGASLYWPKDNVQYVEGFALDQFARGSMGLKPIRATSNRIGLVFDAGMGEEEKMRHLQVAYAARATLGIAVSDYIVTDQPIGVCLGMSPAGASYGTLDRPDVLLRAARRLVEERGCTAIAVVAKFPDDEDPVMLEAYRHGDGVDCIGGAEAIISHLVTQQLSVPCAHAPALPPLDIDADVSPRACAEELGYTFLNCVLANLWRAPHLIPSGNTHESGIWASDVNAIVVPASACGGSAVLSLSRRRVLVIVVQENETGMDATPESVWLDRVENGCEVVKVRSYLEAAGVLAAHRAGVLPSALTPATTKPKILQ